VYQTSVQLLARCRCVREDDVTVVPLCRHGDAVLLQLDVMKSKLDVIEKMFHVSCGVMVVDVHLADWLKQLLLAT